MSRQWLRRITAVGVGLLTLLALIIWIGSRMGLPAPHLRQVGPGGLAGVGAWGPLTVEFSGSMQPESVETRLTIQPAAAGIWRWVDAQHQDIAFWPSLPLTPGTHYTVHLASGAISRAGATLLSTVTWAVTVRQPMALYLSPTTAPDLWQVAGDGAAPLRLTDTGSVVDYAVSMDGRIVYAAKNGQQGVDLWILDDAAQSPRLLLPCQADVCIEPSFAPPGTPAAGLIAYTRRQASGTVGAAPGLPRVWLLDMASQTTTRLLDDPNLGGARSTWSPDGRFLAFVEDDAQMVHVEERPTRTVFSAPASLGTHVTWTPNSQSLWFIQVDSGMEAPAFGLVALDVRTRQTHAVWNDDSGAVDWSTPAFSADGQWAVAARRMVDGSPARQLWLYQMDNSQRMPITTDTLSTHASYSWDPSGRQVILQRLRLGASDQRPEVVVWRRDRNVLFVLAQDAFQPRWLP